MDTGSTRTPREPRNKGKLIGQEAPFKLKEIWAMRTVLETHHRTRDLALFNLGIDSKLRGCDLTSLRARDECHGEQMSSRAVVLQRKTWRPVQFEITPAAREATKAWIAKAHLGSAEYLFPSRGARQRHIGTRQYARILRGWVEALGLDRAAYGAHSTRRSSLVHPRGRAKTDGQESTTI